MQITILKLGLALAIGLLVGLERGWRERDAPPGSRTAGFRTYGLSGFLGGIFAALSDAFQSPAIYGAGFLGFAAAFAWFKSHEAEHDADFSVTGVIAGLAVFALGGLAVAGDYRVAAAGGAVLAGVLASRDVLHGLLSRLTWIELRSALVLAAMTAVGLPLMPDRAIDPWGGLNPFEVWFFTVLVAAISYAGYVAVRILGSQKGVLFSGLAGAVVSSTAVTVAFARAAKDGAAALPLAGTASLAAMVSVLRVAVIVLLIEPAALSVAAPPALAAAAVLALAGALMLFGRHDTGTSEVTHRNPFDLGPLLLFAALFAVVSTASAAAVTLLGSDSLVMTSAVAAIIDVDVSVLSALRMAGDTVTPGVAGTAVLAALAANALGRLSLAGAAGTLAYWLPLAGATVLAAAAGLAAYILVPPL